MDSSKSAFVHTESHLVPLLDELRHREPIFHTKAFGRSRAEWERMTAPDYWEVGASGRRYSRQFILDWLEKHAPVDAASAGWQVCDDALRQLGPDTYLMTYTLQQLDRVTRRTTVWQNAEEGWRILFHQGTVVTAEEDDILTTPPEA
jgi:hypothetical protein